MLKTGAWVLSIWCAINGLLALIILGYVIVLRQDSPILQVAGFSPAEIAALSARTLGALNAFTLLYNSCSLAVSILAWPLIRRELVAGDRRAFWRLVIVIGWIEGMAFWASAYVGHGRWQVNVLQTALYLAGTGLCASALFTPNSRRQARTAA